MAKVLQRLDILLFANTAQYRSEMRDTQQSTTTMLGAIKADAANMAKVGAAAFAGMAAAGTAAIGVMIKEQVELAGEIAALAKVANTGTEQWQKLAIAAKSVGVESETLGDIYKDTQDKIGDFLSTGGGGMADFFENIAPQIGVTAEEFRTLSGPDALQKYYNGLQEANLSQSELIFYMETMASDAALLIPLLHDNGAGFKVWEEAAHNAGVVMTDETIAATKELRASNDLMMLSVDGAKQQFTSAFIPVLADVANKLVGSGDAADIARKAGDFLVKTFKVVAQTGNVVITVFKTVGTVVGGAAATVMTLLDGVSLTDGLFTTAVKIAGNGRAAADVIRNIGYDTKIMWQEVRANNAEIEKLGTGTSNGYVAARIKQNELADKVNRTLGETGQQIQANAAAEEEAAKKAEANAKKQASAAKAASKAAALIPKAVSDAILDGAKKLGINPNDLAAVISFETGGTFSTNARNPTSSATGLIQFMEGSDGKADGKYFGMTREQFGNLLPLQQMDHVVSYLKGRGIKAGANVGQIYDAVAGSGYKRGSAGYESNKVWDVNNDGVVAKGEAVTGKRFKQHIKDYYGDGVAIAQQSISQIMQNEVTAAAEQARLAEQQSKDRNAIRIEYGDEAMRIEEQLKTAILKIEASGFNDDERTAFIDDAIDVANAKLAQMQLTHDQEIQYAQQAQQTDVERIRNQYALERREIEITIGMDKELRTAKINALNQAEQLALDERRYAFESELRQLTSIGQSDLAALRQSYADQRRVLELRKDIDPEQKFKLYQGIDGAQKYDTDQLQKGARDGFNSQKASMGGTGEEYGIAQQYQSRLEVIQEALKAEVITKQQALNEEFEAQRQHEQAMSELRVGQAQGIAGSLSAITKDMFGEQSKIHRAMFIGEKILAVSRSVMNIQVAMSSAAASLPFPANLGAMLTVASNVAGIVSTISSLKPPPIQGQAHDGLDYVPKEGTWMLDEGERVVKPADNRKLTDFLDSKPSMAPAMTPVVNMTIENHAGVPVSHRVDDDGRIRIMVGEELNKQLPQHVNNEYSPFNKALKTNYHLQRNLG